MDRDVVGYAEPAKSKLSDQFLPKAGQFDGGPDGDIWIVIDGRRVDRPDRFWFCSLAHPFLLLRFSAKTVTKCADQKKTLDAAHAAAVADLLAVRHHHAGGNNLSVVEGLHPRLNNPQQLESSRPVDRRDFPSD